MTKDQRPAGSHRYCGRDFSPAEFGAIAELMRSEPKLNPRVRHQITQAIDLCRVRCQTHHYSRVNWAS